MAHVHGADGVGGDELDLGLQTAADVGAGEVHALLARLGEDRVGGLGVQVEVDESGAGDLNLCDGVIGGHVREHGLGDLARGGLRELRGLQSEG